MDSIVLAAPATTSIQTKWTLVLFVILALVGIAGAIARKATLGQILGTMFGALIASFVIVYIFLHMEKVFGKLGDFITWLLDSILSLF